VDVNVAFWLKTVRKPNFPKNLRTAMHVVREGQAIIIHATPNNKLGALLVNTSTMEVEEKFTFNSEECSYFDVNFLHP
jgi:hypothetical protein